MRALITGSRGTVGAALCAWLEQRGHQVIPWDRARVPVADDHAMEACVRAAAPDSVYHLAIAPQPAGRPDEPWLINYRGTGGLAWITRILDIPFVFTSTAMVFSNQA